MNFNEADLLLKLLLSAQGMGQDDGGERTKEIDKLAGMLASADIPYKRITRFNGAQICYYGPHGRQLPPGVKEENCGPGVGAVCSVIPYRDMDGSFSLEISGLMTDEEYERTRDTVLGGLSAENVFERIRKHYTENK